MARTRLPYWHEFRRQMVNCFALAATLMTSRRSSSHVDRNFTASGSNQLCVADVTYVPTAAGFLYLAIVVDAWSRKIVGWSLANHLRTERVLDAMEAAVSQPRSSSVIHHSDQGCQGGFKWSSQHHPERTAALRRGPQVKTCSSSCSASLQPLRSWRLRQTRRSSDRLAGHVAAPGAGFSHLLLEHGLLAVSLNLAPSYRDSLCCNAVPDAVAILLSEPVTAIYSARPPQHS